MDTKRKLAVVRDSRFRSNPAYEMVSLKDLSGAESEFLARLSDDPECFGILRPSEGSRLRLKSVCHETAELFRALETPGKIPVGIVRKLGNRADEQIIELVLDDVLQISRNREFLSGARAYTELYSRARLPDQLGTIATLSLQAVQYGQRLSIEDPIRLSAQMYFYNRAPVTPKWTQRIGDPSAFLRFLGIDDASYTGQILRDAWKSPSSETPGWSCWSNRSARRSERQRSSRYKLYVSPTIESMPDCLRTILEVFADENVARFKFGSDLAGLTRPDKLVAYFPSFELMERVAHQLETRIAGTPAQGVPFTAEISRSGLLSWGIDPHEDPVIEGSERTSWRLWLTHRLAGALLDARGDGSPDTQPWRFALDRVAFDGVDISTWTPTHIDEKKAWR